MHDVFISYSHKNSVIADAICHRLESAGIRCWYAPRNIQPGDEWADAIVKAIKSSRLLVLVFSDESNASTQVGREIGTAVNAGVPIIPFKITTSDPTGSLEYYLNTLHWLDAVDEPLEEAIERLFAMSKAILGASGTDATDTGTPNAGATGAGAEIATDDAARVAEAESHQEQPPKAQQDTMQPAEKQEGSSKRGLYIALAIVVVLAAILIGAFASGVFGNGDSSDSQNTSTSADSSASADPSTSTNANEGSSTSVSQPSTSTTANASANNRDSAEVHSELPYVIAEDELCTIIFAGYHMSGDEPVAEFLFINNSQTGHVFRVKYPVIANGVDIPHFSGPWEYVGPGELVPSWGLFFGYDADGLTISLVDGELETLQCEMGIFEGTSSDAFATYPILWAKDSSTAKDARIMDLPVIDDKDVCSMRITRVTEMHGGYVVVFYDAYGMIESPLEIVFSDDWLVNGQKATVVNDIQSQGGGRSVYKVILLRIEDGERDGAVTSVTGTVSVTDENHDLLTTSIIELTF